MSGLVSRGETGRSQCERTAGTERIHPGGEHQQEQAQNQQGGEARADSRGHGEGATEGWVYAVELVWEKLEAIEVPQAGRIET